MDTCDTAYVWNCSFNDNTATGQGGAIAMVNSHGKGLLPAGSNVTNGQALYGGAIYGGAGASVTISNGSQLVSNQAVTDGGAVFRDGCQQLILQLQTNLSGNTAGGRGGAVFCTVLCAASSHCCAADTQQVRVPESHSLAAHSPALMDGGTSTEDSAYMSGRGRE